MLSGATVVPYLAVSFSVYDQLKAQVKEDRNTRQLWWYPLAKLGMGATASMVAQVLTGPPQQIMRKPLPVLPCFVQGTSVSKMMLRPMDAQVYDAT